MVKIKLETFFYCLTAQAHCCVIWNNIKLYCASNASEYSCLLPSIYTNLVLHLIYYLLNLSASYSVSFVRNARARCFSKEDQNWPLLGQYRVVLNCCTYSDDIFNGRYLIFIHIKCAEFEFNRTNQYSVALKY